MTDDDDALLDDATEQLRAIGLDDEHLARLKATWIVSAIESWRHEKVEGGRVTTTFVTWLGDELANVHATFDGGRLSIVRGAVVETNAKAPTLEEERAAHTAVVLHVVNARDEREAIALMATRYLDKLDGVARAVLGADDKSLPIVRDALRHLVDDLAVSSPVFSTPTQTRNAGRTEWPHSYLDDGLPSWDAALARFINERAGDASDAALVRERGAERAAACTLFAGWLDDAEGSPRLLRTLAHAFREPIERLVRRGHAALVRPVYGVVLDAHTHPPREEDRDGQRIIRLSSGVEVKRPEYLTNDPFLPAETLDALLKIGLPLLSSLDANRLLRMEVHEGFRVHAETGDRVLTFDGGWDEVAERAGITTKKEGREKRARAIVLAQAHLVFSFENGEQGNLLTYREPNAEAHGRSRRVELTLGTAVVPNHVQFIKDRHDRRLVPVLADLPPLVGRPNEHGKLASLALAVVMDLRDRAAELVKHGGAHLNFAALARRVGLPANVLPKVIDAWTTGGGVNDAPALLELVEKDRYTLSKAHSAARDFILKGGRDELDGQRWGQAGVDKKNKGLATGRWGKKRKK